MNHLRSGRLLAILAINVVWLGLLLWSSTETLPVSVMVQPNQVVANVGSVTLAAPTANGSGQGVGFFLQGADPNAAMVWGPQPSPINPTLLDVSSRLAAESAWADPQIVTSRATVNIPECLARVPVQPEEPCPIAWSGDWFRHPLGGLTTERPGSIYLTPAVPPGDTFTVKVNLLRPRNAVGILVDATDGANGMFLFFRPEDRDIVWYQLRDGNLVGPVAAAPYNSFNKTAISGVQDVLRELLGGYPAALLIVGLMLVLGRGLTPRPSPSEMERGEGRGNEGSLLALAPPRPGPESASHPEREEDPATAAPAATMPSPSSTLPLSTGAPSGPGERKREGDVVPRKIGVNGHTSKRATVTVALADGGPVAFRPAATAPHPNQTAGEERIGGRFPRVAISIADVGGLLIGLAGLALFLYVADVLLERIPHVQDSVAYLFQAKTFALGRLSVPIPPDPNSFTHEFIVMKNGQWFSKYPPGWPMVLALGVLVGAPWVVDPLLGALSLYLLYRIGREVYGTPVGLLAAGLGLAAPFLIFLSGSLMAHTSGLFFTLLMVYAVARLEHGGRRVRWGVVAGVAFGMLFLVRPFSGLMVAVPFAVLALVQIARSPVAGRRKWLPVALAAVPFAIVFLLYNKALTGSYTYPPQQLWWAFDQVGFGPNNGPYGFTPIGGLNNTARNLAQLLSHGYGWPPFLTLALASIPFISGRAKTWDWLFLGGFLCLIAGYACWWADGIMYGPRFYFEGFGFLILLTARGVATAVEIGTGQRLARLSNFSFWDTAPLRAWIAPLVMVLLVVGLVAYNVDFYLPGQWQLYHGYNFTNRQQQDLVEKNQIHNAVVFVDPGPSYAWWYYGSVFSANDPLLQGDVIYARDLGPAVDQQVEQDFPTRSAYLLKDGQVTLLSPPQKPHPTFCGPNCPSRG